MLLFLYTLLAFIITSLILPFVLTMLAKAGFVRPNYRNEHIPLGVGLVFFISIVLGSMAVLIISPELKLNLLTMLFALSSLTLLGLIDDLLGTGETRGLKGHFKKLLLERQLTTGALKALMGGFTALVVALTVLEASLEPSFVGLLVLYTLIIALSTNLINLLDLRPGRAGKGFLFVAAFLVMLGFDSQQLPLIGLVIGSLLAYLPKDLAAEAMMGDTGSNLLGVTLGVFSVWVLTFKYQLIFFILLIILHIITEKYSLTKIIENNKVLKFLDMLGRG